MADSKRVRLTPEARRAQLIELGVEMLSTRPLEQVSIDDIADQAGVSRGLLFHYFSSKQDFHLAIVRHTSQEMLERTEPGSSTDPLEILRSAMDSYIDYVSENRNSYISLLRGTASGDPEMRAVFEDTRAQMAERILTRVHLLGITRSPAIDLLVRGWIAMVEEVVISWLREETVSREVLLNMITTALPVMAFAVAETAVTSG